MRTLLTTSCLLALSLGVLAAPAFAAPPAGDLSAREGTPESAGPVAAPRTDFDLAAYDAAIQRADQAEARDAPGEAVAYLRRATHMRPKAKRAHARLCTLLTAERSHADALPACEAWLALEKNKTYQRSIRLKVKVLKSRLAATAR
jgi:hypothetical protein